MSGYRAHFYRWLTQVVIWMLALGPLSLPVQAAPSPVPTDDDLVVEQADLAFGMAGATTQQSITPDTGEPEDVTRSSIEPRRALTETDAITSTLPVTGTVEAVLIVDFVGEPRHGPAPLAVQFTATVTAEVDSWAWDFGDGTASSETNPLHTYEAAGAYTVTLAAAGPSGTGTLTREEYILVEAVVVSQPPVVDFAAEPQQGAAPLAVQFTSTTAGEVDRWEWDFGDGTTSTEPSLTHLFERPGLYTIHLTVTGPTGTGESIHVGYINVMETAPDSSVPVTETSSLSTTTGIDLPVPAVPDPGNWISREQALLASYQIAWREEPSLPDVPAAWSTTNVHHGLRVYFVPSGLHITSDRETDRSWQWGMQLTGYGYAHDIRQVPPAVLEVTDNQITYRHDNAVPRSPGGLSEWYVNNERGIKQGFTLESPPGAKSSAPLVLEFALSGDLQTFLFGDPGLGWGPGETVFEFVTADGVSVLRYGGLRVYDVSGRELPAYMAPILPASGHPITSTAAADWQEDGSTADGMRAPFAMTGIQLVVDDTDAVYPITIDPLLTGLSSFSYSGNQVVFSNDLEATATGWDILEIAAMVPSGVVSGPVVVDTDRGTSNEAPFIVGTLSVPDGSGEGTSWSTNVSGTISTNTTWNSNVRVVGDVEVAAGVTLTIAPGVTVFFAAGSDSRATGLWANRAELKVVGKLVAEGTPAAPIYFTSDAAQKAAGDWGGVVIGTDDVQSSIKYCVVRYARWGVVYWVNGQGAGTLAGRLGNCLFENNQIGARINADPGYPAGGTLQIRLVIEDNLFRENTEYGVLVADGNGYGTTLDYTLIRNNVVENNHIGISLITSSWWAGHIDNYAEVRNNAVRDCTTYGIDIQAYGSSDSSGSDTDVRPLVENNLLEGNNANVHLLLYPYGSDGTQILSPTIRYNTVRDTTYGVVVEDTQPYDTLTPLLSHNVFYGLSSYAVDNRTARTVTATNNYWGDTVVEWDAGAQAGDIHGTVITSNHLISTSVPVLSCIDPGVGQADEEIILYGANFGRAQLEIGKTAPSRVIAGQQITYTLTVTNSGPAVATSILITDQIPTGASYISGGTHVGDVVSWTVSSLAAGSSTQVTFVVTASATITNVDYGAAADAGVSVAGNQQIVTVVSPPGFGRVLFYPDLEATVIGWNILEIAAVIPSGVVSGPVVVDTDHGTSNEAPFTVGILSVPDGSGEGTSWSTDVSGIISTDTVWNSNVRVVGDVEVAAGVTLTIAPGVTVFFAAGSDSRATGWWTDRAELTVRGKLVAEGTPAAPIHFTSDAAQKAAGDWGGVFISTDDTESSIKYCVVRYARWGVAYWLNGQGAGTLSGRLGNCLFQNNVVGIYTYAYPGYPAGGTLEVRLVIEDNLFQYNTDDGMVFAIASGYGTTTDYSLIQNNVIESSGTGMLFSIYSWWWGHADHYVEVRNNTIRNCTTYGIDIQAQGSGDSSGSDTDVRTLIENDLLEGNNTNLRLLLNPIGSDGTQILSPTVRYNTVRNAPYGIVVEDTEPYDTLTPLISHNVFYGLSGYAVDNRTARTITANDNYWGDTVVEWDAGPQAGDVNGTVITSSHLVSTSVPVLSRLDPGVGQADDEVTLHGANLGIHAFSTADFEATPLSGPAPLTVTLTNLSTNATGYEWAYGDGITSTTAALTHTHVYTAAGVYTVSLAATGPGGTDILTRTNYITVTEQAAEMFWWDDDWFYRQMLTITVSETLVYSPDVTTTLSITLDTASLVEAGKMRSNGSDLRIVYWDGTGWIELPCAVSWIDTPTTTVQFPLQATILDTSEQYYLYYGNAVADWPPLLDTDEITTTVTVTSEISGELTPAVTAAISASIPISQSVTSAEGWTDVTFPPDAIAEDVIVSYVPHQASLDQGPDHLTRFDVVAHTLSGITVTTFAEPLRISYRYGHLGLSAEEAETVRFFYWNETAETWEPLTPTLDLVNQTAWITTTHLSEYAVAKNYGLGDGPSRRPVPTLAPAGVDMLSGAATYVYPLEVPPGVHGMQPNLALVYNSSTADATFGSQPGIVGLGFGLETGFVQCDGNECFLNLNGVSQSLVPEAGNPDRYHTERESFWRIERMTGGTNGVDDVYWVVNTGNGFTYRLGYNSNSIGLSLGYTEGAGGLTPFQEEVSFYYLDEIQDTYSNTVEFGYRRQEAEHSHVLCDTNGCMHWYVQSSSPEVITYTRNIALGLEPMARIRFGYGGGIRSDFPDKYASGVQQRYGYDEALKWITMEVRTKPGAEFDPVRSYGLDYRYYTQDGQDPETAWFKALMLERITEYGRNGDPLPATVLTYNQTGQLAHIDNGYGGHVDYHYELVLFRNGKKDTDRWAVSTRTVTTTEYVTVFNYSFPWAYVRDKDNAYLGHAFSWVFNPTGDATEYCFNTDGGSGLEGTLQNLWVYDAAGQFVRTISNTYTVSQCIPEASEVRCVYLTAESDTPGSGAGGEGIRLEYEYDVYIGTPTGRVKTVRQFADGALNTTTQITYSYNLGNWRLDLPEVQDTLDSDGQLLARTEYEYFWRMDNLAALQSIETTQRELNDESDNLLASDLDTEYQFDEYGNIIQQRVGGNGTTIAYDLWHTFPMTVTTVIENNDLKTVSYYDPGLGAITRTVDMNGLQTVYDYDQFGRVLAVQQFTSTQDILSRVVYQYDQSAIAAGQTITIVRQSDTAPDQYSWLFYDGLGRLWRQQSEWNGGPQGTRLTVDYTYDGLERLIGQTTPYTNAVLGETGYAYDALGRLITTTNPNGTERTVLYDDDGRQVTLVDENAHQKVYEHDAWGHVTAVYEYTGTHPSAQLYATTTYTYDALGNLLKIWDDMGNQTEFEYDALGRRIFLNDPDAGSWVYDYDSDGTLFIQYNAAEDMGIGFEWDPLNRVVAKRVCSGGDDGWNCYFDLASYTYDEGENGRGHLTGMTDLYGSTVYSYDIQGRLIDEIRIARDAAYDSNGLVAETETVAEAIYTTAYTYDDLDRLSTLIYPDGESVAYTYNVQNLAYNLASSWGGTYLQSANYNTLGQPTAMQWGSGRTTSYTYQPLTWRLQTLTTGGIQYLDFEYDDVGNLTGVSDLINSVDQEYIYDPLDRLVAVTGDYPQTYVYDTIGNMTIKNGLLLTYTQGGLVHAPSAAGLPGQPAFTYDYDLRGNRVSRQVISGGIESEIAFVYDVESRLTAVVSVTESSEVITDLVVLTFAYDGSGGRAARVGPAGVTQYAGTHYERHFGRLQPDRLVNRRKGENAAPQVATGTDGSAHILWDGENGSYRALYYTRQSAAGTWLTSTVHSPVLTTTVSSYYKLHPSMAVEDEDQVHVVWLAPGMTVTETDIVYAHGISETWVAPVHITMTEAITSHTPDYASPVIAVRDGIAHILYVDNGASLTPTVYYVQVDENGQTGDPTAIYTDELGLEGDILDLQLALDAEGTPHLAWLRSWDLPYPSYDSGTYLYYGVLTDTAQGIGAIRVDNVPPDAEEAELYAPRLAITEGLAYLSWCTSSAVYLISGTAPVTTAWSGGVVYTYVIDFDAPESDQVHPSSALLWNSAGELYLVWNELRVQEPDTVGFIAAYESKVYYAALTAGAPLSRSLVSDHLGLGSVYDGQDLSAAAGLTGTVHIVWSAAHPADLAAGASSPDDNIYYDLLDPAELGKAETTRYYQTGGRAIALRTGPEGEEGEVYYLHGDQAGSTVLVTDDQGAYVGYAFYDPLGGAITSTIPLTLTNRLFEGQPFDAEAGLAYHGNGRFYEPQTGLYVQPAPAGAVPLLPQTQNLYRYMPARTSCATCGQGAELPLADVVGVSADLIWEMVGNSKRCIGQRAIAGKIRMTVRKTVVTTNQWLDPDMHELLDLHQVGDGSRKRWIVESAELDIKTAQRVLKELRKPGALPTGGSSGKTSYVDEVIETRWGSIYGTKWDDLPWWNAAGVGVDFALGTWFQFAEDVNNPLLTPSQIAGRAAVSGLGGAVVSWLAGKAGKAIAEYWGIPDPRVAVVALGAELLGGLIWEWGLKDLVFDWLNLGPADRNLQPLPIQ